MPNATIGDLKRHGNSGFMTKCRCGAEATYWFREMQLHNDMTIPGVMKSRVFNCGSCGQRVTKAYPDWSIKDGELSVKPGMPWE